jgi:3-methyladenine DNA glycosylase AlkD
MDNELIQIKKEIRKMADPKKAKILQGFFKTGKGQYGEGDIFLGLTVPKSRSIAKKFPNLDLSNNLKLLTSKIHEERLIALVILCAQFNKGDKTNKQLIYNYYLKHSAKINNWDLVDISAHKIVGAYLHGKSPAILYKLAKSKNLWQRRIAIISTFYFIKYKVFEPTKKIALMLLSDNHDLIHKATGWMLREMGKISLPDLTYFLKPVYKTMPRTALRYAIEKFPKQTRNKYLLGKI